MHTPRRCPRSPLDNHQHCGRVQLTNYYLAAGATLTEQAL